MSAELMKKLKEAGLGKRPIVWVGHSLGGIVPYLFQELFNCWVALV